MRIILFYKVIFSSYRKRFPNPMVEVDFPIISKGDRKLPKGCYRLYCCKEPCGMLRFPGEAPFLPNDGEFLLPFLRFRQRRESYTLALFEFLLLQRESVYSRGQWKRCSLRYKGEGASSGSPASPVQSLFRFPKDGQFPVRGAECTLLRPLIVLSSGGACLLLRCSL